MSDTPDRIARWSAEATALGLSYGQYVAKYHPPGAPSAPPVSTAQRYTKTCPECGQVFRTNYGNRIYCGEPCYNRANNRRYYEKSRAKENAIC